MIDFLLSDNVSLVAVLLVLGGIILFIIVLKNIFSHKLKEADEEGISETTNLSQPLENSTLSLLEVHLNTISEEISKINDKLSLIISKVDNLSISEGDITQEGVRQLQEQMSKINTKLDVMYRLIADTK